MSRSDAARAGDEPEGKEADMKIRDVRTHVLRYDLAESEVFGSSKGFRRDRQSLLVEIVTDDGLAGWGEAHGPPALSQPVVDNVYKPRLLGRDPLDHGVLWHELYGPNHHAGSALSAIDVALWDLKGQALNLPVYQLLGGAPPRPGPPGAPGPASCAPARRASSTARRATARGRWPRRPPATRRRASAQ